MSHFPSEPQPGVSRTLYLLSASVLVTMTGLGIIWPLVPVYAQEMGATGLQLGLIISSFPLARTLFNAPVGRLSDLRGRKPILSVGLLAYAAVSVLYVLASKLEWLLLVRFLHGLASVLVAPVAMAMAGDIAPLDRVGLYMGTLNMAVMLGLGIGPILGGLIRDQFGMDAAFYAMGGLTLLTFFGVRLFLPGEPLKRQEREGHSLAPFHDIFKHPIIVGLFLLRLVSASGQGCVYTFLPLLGLYAGISSSQVGMILGANVLLVAFLQRSFGAMADRLNPVHQVVSGTLISGLAVLLMPFSGGFEGLLAFNLLMGLGSGIAMPAGLALSARAGRTLGMGLVMGFTETGAGLGMIASPILSGLIMDALDLPSIFLVGGGLILVGTFPVFLYLRGYEHKP